MWKFYYVCSLVIENKATAARDPPLLYALSIFSLFSTAFKGALTCAEGERGAAGGCWSVGLDGVKLGYGWVRQQHSGVRSWLRAADYCICIDWAPAFSISMNSFEPLRVGVMWGFAWSLWYFFKHDAVVMPPEGRRQPFPVNQQLCVPRFFNTPYL